MNFLQQGKLFIISGPSGSGKSTILKEVFPEIPKAHFSVSATTRTPRPDELDGVHYDFMSEETFLDLKNKGGLLESNYHFGNWYGTPKEPIEQRISKGEDVLLDIEVEGAAQVKGKMPGAVTIFLFPPSMAILEERLRKRGTDTEEKIIKRLARAEEELERAMFYDYLVINDKIDTAVDEVLSIIKAEGTRLSARKHLLLL